MPKFKKKIHIRSFWSAIEEDHGKQIGYIARSLLFLIITYDCFWNIGFKDNLIFYILII